MIRSLVRASGLLPMLLWVSGCGNETPPPREKTVPASGRITYKGQPVPDASASFVPETALGPTEAGKGRGAFGRTDAQGRFTLMTFQSGDGVVPGTYKVTVAKVEAEARPMPEDGADDYVDPESMPPRLPRSTSCRRSTPTGGRPT